MKKLLNILLVMLVFNTAGFAQTIVLKDAKLESKIIALEKSGWNAWKNKDAAWFKVNTTEEFLSINSDGISDKVQVVKSTPIDCNVNSVSVDNFKFVMLNEYVVLLTIQQYKTVNVVAKNLLIKFVLL